MSSRPVSIAPQIPLSETFSDMSVAFRSYVLSGFRIFSGLPSEAQEIVEQTIFEKLNTNRETDVDMFAASAGISQEDAGPLISMATLLLAVISARLDSSSEITQGMIDAKLLDGQSENSAKRLIEYLTNKRGDIQRSMRLGAIADRILPSYRAFNSSVEVRLGYKDGLVEAAVPIIVGHLDTDKDGNEVYFQMTGADLSSLRKHLDQVAREFEAAEAWMKTK